MPNESAVAETWLPVIGRALAHLCLHIGKHGEKTMAEQAKMLEGIGLPRKDVADMLGTTSASIAELLRQARAKKNRKKPNGARKRR